MNYLVTGGAGFIGSNFIQYLLEQDEFEVSKVVNLDKLTYAGNLNNLTSCEKDARYDFVEGDIGDGELVARLLLKNGINAVINFAAESHVDRSIDAPETFFETNVMGTLKLIDVCKRHWMASKEHGLPFRFHHVSTEEVYGSLTKVIPMSRIVHILLLRHRVIILFERTITLMECR